MAKTTNRKVVVGLSGGVDSSVALLLLKQQGYEPIGVSLKYDVWKDKCNISENVCCSKESFSIAKKICAKLHVPYHIVEVKNKFDKEVISYFKEELRAGRTPSPCVFCNRNLKFRVLLEQAKRFGAGFVATGHYAKTVKSKKIKGKRGEPQYQLLRAKDKTKDQTYSLCFLTQKQLSKVIFPLGDLTKTEVYGIAKNAGFDWFEKRKQSQDFCFVSGSAMDSFLEKEIGVRAGDIADEKGNVLGSHKGLHFYTIGQRKGINLAGGPYFVVAKDIKRNRLIVSKNESLSDKKEIVIKNANLISQNIKFPALVSAKIRSAQKLARATLSKEGSAYQLKFSKPQHAVTSGQIAVFYKGEKCLGAGQII